MNKYILGLGGMFVALLIAGFGCNKPVVEQTPQVVPETNREASEATAPTENETPVAPVIDVQVDAKAEVKPSAPTQPVVKAPEPVTVAVSGVNFAFAPNLIKVKKGQKVTINFKSDMGFHDFVIDEFNVRAPQLKYPGTASVTFTPDKVGTFEYYCSVGQHRVNGMVGKLVVE